MVAPLIDYCCLVYNSLNQELNTELERLLNSCIRFIFNVPFDEDITPYYNELGRLRLSKKREYILGIFIFNLFECKSPEYLYNKFLFKNSVSSRALRTYGLDLQIPIHRTSLLSIPQSSGIKFLPMWVGRNRSALLKQSIFIYFSRARLRCYVLNFYCSCWSFWDVFFFLQFPIINWF